MVGVDAVAALLAKLGTRVAAVKLSVPWVKLPPLKVPPVNDPPLNFVVSIVVGTLVAQEYVAEV